MCICVCVNAFWASVCHLNTPKGNCRAFSKKLECQVYPTWIFIVRCKYDRDKRNNAFWCRTIQTHLLLIFATHSLSYFAETASPHTKKLIDWAKQRRGKQESWDRGKKRSWRWYGNGGAWCHNFYIVTWKQWREVHQATNGDKNNNVYFSAIL